MSNQTTKTIIAENVDNSLVAQARLAEQNNTYTAGLFGKLADEIEGLENVIRSLNRRIDNREDQIAAILNALSSISSTKGPRHEKSK